MVKDSWKFLFCWLLGVFGSLDGPRVFWAGTPTAIITPRGQLDLSAARALASSLAQNLTSDFTKSGSICCDMLWHGGIAGLEGFIERFLRFSFFVVVSLRFLKFSGPRTGICVMIWDRRGSGSSSAWAPLTQPSLPEEDPWHSMTTVFACFCYILLYSRITTAATHDSVAHFPFFCWGSARPEAAWTATESYLCLFFLLAAFAVDSRWFFCFEIATVESLCCFPFSKHKKSESLRRHPWSQRLLLDSAELGNPICLLLGTKGSQVDSGGLVFQISTAPKGKRCWVVLALWMLGICIPFRRWTREKLNLSSAVGNYSHLGTSYGGNYMREHSLYFLLMYMINVTFGECCFFYCNLGYLALLLADASWGWAWAQVPGSLPCSPLAIPSACPSWPYCPRAMLPGWRGCWRRLRKNGSRIGNPGDIWGQQPQMQMGCDFADIQRTCKSNCIMQLS